MPMYCIRNCLHNVDKSITLTLIINNYTNENTNATKYIELQLRK